MIVPTATTGFSFMHSYVPEWRMRRALTYSLVAVSVVALFYASAWVYFWAAYTPSKIVAFHATNFRAKAVKNFFYSIGDELKNSDELSVEAPTLLRGRIWNFLVSPDGTKIAVVANKLLMVVGGQDYVIRQVATVDSIYREPKPLGQSFYRDDDFQWSSDSKSLYFIKDEYYVSKGSQLFSKKGELWKYDIQTEGIQLVLKPFPAYTYFFGRNAGIYFSVPTESGDLRLKYFDGNRVTDVGAPNASAVPPDKLSSNFVESPFFSFSILDYERVVLPEKRVALSSDQQGGFERLEIANRPYLTLSRGKGIKGDYYCSDTLRSVFLPGDRFFLFNVPYCGNYKGQLLIDTVTGNYQRLPQNTRVYLTLNTDTNPHYRITSGGMLPN
jgi:hypothetical protein